MQSLPIHPDSLAEYDHLQVTRDEIDRETADLRRLLGLADDDEACVSVDISADDTEVQQQMAAIRLDRLRQLGLSAGQAYFARLDFIPTGEKKETWYLGRWGVLGHQNDPVVVDWRSPMANLYYSGQIGQMDYEAPDGHVTGELKLKRMLTIRDRELIGMFDSGIAAQETYLQEVLGSVSTERMKEIVTTIQAEQNRVIRHPLNRNLTVQGIAGSGKTSVALHRIAYLLYTHQERLHPENMMILAPNPLFLSYISQLLPDLGVERVRQTTFADWCVSVAGKRFPKYRLTDRLEKNLTATATEREIQAIPVRKKGSLEMMEALERFLKKLPERMIPEDGIRMGPFEIMPKAELENLFLVQFGRYPLEQRIEELKKPVRKRLMTVCERVKEQYETMTGDRLDQLLARMSDGPERREKAGRLIASRDQRLREIEEKKNQFLKEWTTQFPVPDPVQLYMSFLAEWDEEIQEATAAYAERTILGEDLAPVLMICGALYGLKSGKLRHIVIDECQDVSPFRLAMLKRMHPMASFTLVGDLHQGIHADEGIRSWESQIQPLFKETGDYCELQVSYRSTVEIMELAARVAQRYPVPHVSAGSPVLRHGEVPEMKTVQSENERMDEITKRTRAWLTEGYHSIALIEKTRKQAEDLHQKLKNRLNARLIREGDKDYQGGVLILSASMVKGMEFDCVLLCDAGKETFPDDEFHDRVLYVLMTRPLHRLAVLAKGEMTELIGK